jgi:hypothetical protein
VLSICVCFKNTRAEIPRFRHLNRERKLPIRSVGKRAAYYTCGHPFAYALTRQLRPISLPAISLVVYQQEYLGVASLCMRVSLKVLLYLQGTWIWMLGFKVSRPRLHSNQLQIRHSDLFPCRKPEDCRFESR